VIRTRRRPDHRAPRRGGPSEEGRRIATSHHVLRELPYQMLPVLRASNGPVFIHPDDRRYGVRAVGGQGSGKTAFLLRLYQSDIRDPNASPIVVDPKSELAKQCLEMTPPTCGKRVWYLDLGRPMFGMSPLRRDPDRKLAEQASSIADLVVQAISDTAEGQVFQSSKRYLYHATIGALALANKHGGLAMFEDIFALLLPSRDDLREAAVNACQEWADLDHTTEFFRTVLPDELDSNRTSTYQRLDPPRNKIEAILGSPALRRFYNHPTDVSLRDIVMARDILIIDANMAAVGEGGAQIVMHLFFQQLHRLMQEQVHLPAQERPRVPTEWDEGHYLATWTNMKQAATHREAGLEVAMGTQYTAQLGASAESASITEAIRKGATNLLQSQAIFRLSDPEDAEAQSVYQTRFTADLQSRELMGATPEKSTHLRNHYCLASLIAGGARAEAFYAETFPFPKIRGGPWAEHHLRVLEEAVGPYPEQLPKTYRREGSSAAAEQQSPVDKPTTPRPVAEDLPPSRPRASAPSPCERQPEPPAASQVTPLIREAGEVPEVERSALRTILAATPAPQRSAEPPPDGPGAAGLRELAAFVDPLLGIRDCEQRDPTDRLPRLYKEDYAILALLDRIGLALPGMLGRAATPGAAERTLRDRLNGKLYKHGLIARWPIVLRDPQRGALPYLYGLTRYGLQVAQSKQPPAIPPSREFRAQEVAKDGNLRHDMHLLSWLIDFRALLGSQATEKWRTPRWPAGTCPVPQVGNGRNRRPMTLKDINLPKHVGIFDVDSADVGRIEPDAICEVHLSEHGITFDLIIELDLTDRASYNVPKLRRYDAFLTGWWGELRRYRQLGTRPGVLFVCRNADVVLACARAADETLRGSVGVTGSPAHERYYPAREHVWFAEESDIYNGSLAVLALPSLPPDVREALDGTRDLSLARVLLLDDRALRAGHDPSKSRGRGSRSGLSQS
jgi:hypothetical protein